MKIGSIFEADYPVKIGTYKSIGDKIVGVTIHSYYFDVPNRRTNCDLRFAETEIEDDEIKIIGSIIKGIFYNSTEIVVGIEYVSLKEATFKRVYNKELN